MVIGEVICYVVLPRALFTFDKCAFREDGINGRRLCGAAAVAPLWVEIIVRADTAFAGTKFLLLLKLVLTLLLFLFWLAERAVSGILELQLARLRLARALCAIFWLFILLLSVAFFVSFLSFSAVTGVITCYCLFYLSNFCCSCCCCYNLG